MTGGAGFIGSTLVELLVRHGAQVLVIDDMSHGRLANLDCVAAEIDVLEHDLRVEQPLPKVFEEYRPDTIFHLAAQIDVRTSMRFPAHDAEVNVLGSLNVFAAAAATGVRRVVNTSTGGALYGPAAPIPTPETAAAEPQSAYGLSKRTVEAYAGWFGETTGLNIVTLRYSNVYGPGQFPGDGAGVVASFCAAALQHRRPVIYGDGHQTRDFVYVDDVAAANLAVAQLAEPRHPVYNIGTGREITIAELAETVTLAADADPTLLTPIFAPARPGEVLRSCLAVDRARGEGLLGGHTPLPEGLRQTLEWIRNSEPVDHAQAV